MHYLPDIFLSPTGDLVAGFLRRIAVGYVFFLFHVSLLRHENTKKDEQHSLLVFVPHSDRLSNYCR